MKHSTQLRDSPMTLTPERFTNMGIMLNTDPIILGREHTRQIGQKILLGLAHYTAEPEDTAAERCTGLPTSIARIDATLTASGAIHAYEIEERPNGIGLAGICLAKHGDGFAFRVLNHLQEMFGETPVSLKAPDRSFCDDSLIFDQQPLDLAQPVTRPVLVRAEPSQITEDCDESIIRNSVSTVRTEGNKGYRILVGDSRAICHPSQLPEGSFVAKAPQGSKSRGVKIFLAPEDRKLHGTNGTITASKMKEFADCVIAQSGHMLIEDFVPPIPCRSEEKPLHMILRIFALVNRGSVRVIGGLAVARKELIVHGASNAITIPVLCEELPVSN